MFHFRIYLQLRMPRFSKLIKFVTTLNLYAIAGVVHAPFFIDNFLYALGVFALECFHF